MYMYPLSAQKRIDHLMINHSDIVNNILYTCRWEHVKKAYLKTSKACLGKKERQTLR